MAPAVSPRSQVRRPASSILVEGGGYLADVHAKQRRLDDHLRGKLHTARLQIHAVERLARKPAHPAMEVADRSSKKHLPDSRKDGIADVPVLPRHRTRTNASLEAVAHDHVATLA